MKIESGISGRRDAVDWLVIESIAQKEESVNRYYRKFDIVRYCLDLRDEAGQ